VVAASLSHSASVILLCKGLQSHDPGVPLVTVVTGLSPVSSKAYPVSIHAERNIRGCQCRSVPLLCFISVCVVQLTNLPRDFPVASLKALGRFSFYMFLYYLEKLILLPAYSKAVIDDRNAVVGMDGHHVFHSLAILLVCKSCSSSPY